MARIAVNLPKHFPFSTEIPVNTGQINQAGHLDNAQLLAIVSEVRMRYVKSLGYPNELDIEGVGVIIADAAVQYKSEAFLDEVMVVRMTAGDFSPKGCDLLWIMSEKISGREVARGKTGVIFFDYANRKVAAVPASFRQRADA